MNTCSVCLEQKILEQKTCTLCFETKVLSLFRKNKRRKDGLSTRCIECDKKTFQAWLETKPNYHKEYRDSHPEVVERNKIYLKTYRNLHMKEYRVENAEKIRLNDRIRYKNIRQEALNILGGKCADCGEHELEFMTVDHINNDGHLETKHHSRIRADIVKGRSDNSRFQVLCRNCNDGKANALIHQSVYKSKHEPIDICKICNNRSIIKHKSGSRFKLECLYCRKQESSILKAKVIDLFGGQCNCCSQIDIEKLTIDHIHNDGNELRLMDKCGTVQFYKKILKMFDSNLIYDTYQILCWNCNFSKHLGNGICVHKREEAIEHGL